MGLVAIQAQAELEFLTIPGGRNLESPETIALGAHSCRQDGLGSGEPRKLEPPRLVRLDRVGSHAHAGTLDGVAAIGVDDAPPHDQAGLEDDRQLLTGLAAEELARRGEATCGDAQAQALPILGNVQGEPPGGIRRRRLERLRGSAADSAGEQHDEGTADGRTSLGGGHTSLHLPGLGRQRSGQAGHEAGDEERSTHGRSPP